MAKRNKAPKNPGIQPATVVVNDITQVSPSRGRKDVGMLRSGIERAESIYTPNRSKLYDLYHDIITIDGHLSGILEKRTNAILNKALRFVDKNGKRADAFDPLFQSQKFDDLIKLIMESRYWGISGVEFVVGEEFDFVEIPRKHIRPEKGYIVKSQFDNEGMPIKDLPFVWTIGKEKDLGLLLTCSMYALYKRSGFGDFAQYVEIFGQPVRIIYYDAYDFRTKEELSKILKSSGSSLAMMIPKQAQFEMLDGKTSNGNGELQEKLIRCCNEEMSIAILGNSETTASSASSGYAQAKEHGKQQLEITKADLTFVEKTLNTPWFFRILKSYGFPVEGGRFEYEKELDLESLKARLEIDREVSGKVPIDDDYWYETYGIPKPDNYDELKAAQEEQRQAALTAIQGAGAQKEEEKKELPPKERRLFDALLGFFGVAPNNSGASDWD